MLHQTDGLSLQSPIRPLSVLVFYLLLTHSCRGQPQLIGSSQPIVATLGDDIIVPCHLEPADDVSGLTLEWARPDLNPRFVHVWRSGIELVSKKHKSFEGRTSLFIDELKIGNASLKLSNVTLADRGTYKCYLPGLERQSLIQLVVGAVASAVITLSGMDRVRGGVLLDCASRGWYPQPEVLWLDGEGNLLSAGPTETERGPDHLYTVSSRVTVEKTHSNSFTCRVQQRTTNQTRETHITVPDDFFTVQSSSVPIITGLAVCILMILFLLFVVWRQNTIKNKRSSSDEAPEGQKEIRFKTNGTEDQCVTADGEREQLMTDGPEPVQLVQDNGQKKSRHQQRREEEQQRREEELQRREEELQRREEAEKEVQTLKEELETKKNEVETKRAELQKLHEEKKKNETELQNLKEQLKNREEIIQKNQSKYFKGHSKRDEKKKEVETLKKSLELEQEELNTNTKKIEDIEAEVQQLQDQIQRMETNLQTLMESSNMELENKEQRAEKWRTSNEELKKANSELKSRNEEISQLKREFEQKLWDQTKKSEHEEDMKQLVHATTCEEQEHHSHQEDSSSANHSSASGSLLVIGVDQQGKYIHLTNTSNEEQQLGGWRLEMQVNGKIISFTFEKSFSVKSGDNVTDFKPFSPADRLKFTLINITGEIRHELRSLTE
ncbi:uncharacterized protein PEZ65_022352 [Lycodopsis pacificus]